MLPSENVWRLHLRPPYKLRDELFHAALSEQKISELSDLELEERGDLELEKAIEPVRMGLALFVAALIRDFWVVERREVLFTDKREVRSITKLHGQRKKPVVIYLPRIRYLRNTTTDSCGHIGNTSRRPHEVSEHMRKCENADPRQLALANAIGSRGATLLGRGTGAIWETKP